MKLLVLFALNLAFVQLNLVQKDMISSRRAKSSSHEWVGGCMQL